MILFIDPEYLKNNTFLNGSVEDSYLRPAMNLAQDKWISPYLGDNLYSKLKTDVENSTLTGDYLTLVRDYIRPALAWWTVVEYMPNALNKIDNSGIVQRTSEDVQPASSADATRLQEQARQSAHYYTEIMWRYLCHNSDLFDEYSENTNEQRHPIRFKSSYNGMTVSRGHGYHVPKIPRDWIYGDE